jgi:hypothetical protein
MSVGNKRSQSPEDFSSPNQKRLAERQRQGTESEEGREATPINSLVSRTSIILEPTSPSLTNNKLDKSSSQSEAVAASSPNSTSIQQATKSGSMARYSPREQEIAQIISAAGHNKPSTYDSNKESAAIRVSPSDPPPMSPRKFRGGDKSDLQDSASEMDTATALLDINRRSVLRTVAPPIDIRYSFKDVEHYFFKPQYQGIERLVCRCH